MNRTNEFRSGESMQNYQKVVQIRDSINQTLANFNEGFLQKMQEDINSSKSSHSMKAATSVWITDLIKYHNSITKQISLLDGITSGSPKSGSDLQRLKKETVEIAMKLEDFFEKQISSAKAFISFLEESKPIPYVSINQL